MYIPGSNDVPVISALARLQIVLVLALAYGTCGNVVGYKKPVFTNS